MPEEVGVILNNLTSIESLKFGDFELYSGKLKINNSNDVFITTAWSGWGKVSAARATTRLLSSNFHSIPVQLAIFTGVAGAVDKKLKQWDIILSHSVMQHDMDARPLFDKYVIPAINNKLITPNNDFLEIIFNSLKEELTHKNLSKFGCLYKGLIGTGDIFISSKKKIDQLSQEIMGLSAVEMEGAAFAQVAFQEKVEWMVMRVISDDANENAPNDFKKFIDEYKLQSFDLIKCFLKALDKNYS